MNKICASLVAVALCSCTSPVSRFRFRGMNVRVVVTPQKSVDQHCQNLWKRRTGSPAHSDSGSLVPLGGILCCADQYKRIIWVGKGHESCIPHEMCHLENPNPLDCDAIHIK